MNQATLPHRILVVGNGMVGHHLVSQLQSMQEQGSSRPLQITVVGGETRPAYDRVHLSDWFQNRDAADLALANPADYAAWNVRLLLGDPVASIQREQHLAITASGQQLAYDSLVLATGSRAFVPPVAGHDLPHCHPYRTLDDLEAIAASADQAKVGVVVGGGLLGLEAANALRTLGLDTHVVEFAPRLMGVQLDTGGSGMLRSMIEDLGVQVHTERNTQLIAAADGPCRYRMAFADDSHLDTDLVVFSAGIRPMDELAREAGLVVGERGGVVVNNQCRSSDPAIYAVGECALWDGRIFGLVAPGYDMARVAADQLAGAGKRRFTGADMSTKLKLLGLDVASIGDAQATSKGARCITWTDEPNQVYKRLVVNSSGKKLLGAVLVGDASEYATLQQMVVNDLVLPVAAAQLILPDSGPASQAMVTLPDSAQVCSCHDVSKGALCQAVAAGDTTLGALKASTCAGTGCGGCVPLVTQVLHEEMAHLGLEVNTDLCEHFQHTRQALYHLVRVEEIKTFQELLARHGSGLGCDICKPTVASILASCWNEYVLTDAHAPLQDTNDRFLANLQKNGTYSVVPRVPGGEITPRQLITLGTVAERYNLYSKITGGQRVDLFGARVDQLPAIWQELIDAGFETGHAYGKAMRTVKSCVGSTWCRFGLLDSVAMALRLEHRYKGLRAPHKIKLAVSGCTRECAEAQSKDIGVIATENGWNLYVCGNGGMRPRHADLFATGLDDDALIQAIDRTLMFYVRTADRLQRTSVWLEHMDGGLAYLKQVVLEDSLGIGAQLQADMAGIVDSYQCEWTTTLADPAKLAKFRPFINSDAPDDTIHFVQERGQPRPARANEIPLQEIPA